MAGEKGPGPVRARFGFVSFRFEHRTPPRPLTKWIHAWVSQCGHGVLNHVQSVWPFVAISSSFTYYTMMHHACIAVVQVGHLI